MARPISQGPPACAAAPSTTSPRTSKSLPPYGRNSPRRRLVVAPRSPARSCGTRAIDSMPLIFVLLWRLPRSLRGRELQGRGQNLGTHHRGRRSWRGLFVLAPDGIAYRLYRRLFVGRGGAHGDAGVLHVQRAIGVGRDLPVPAALGPAHRAYEDLASRNYHPDDGAVFGSVFAAAG